MRDIITVDKADMVLSASECTVRVCDSCDGLVLSASAIARAGTAKGLRPYRSKGHRDDKPDPSIVLLESALTFLEGLFK